MIKKSRRLCCFCAGMLIFNVSWRVSNLLWSVGVHSFLPVNVGRIAKTRMHRSYTCTIWHARLGCPLHICTQLMPTNTINLQGARVKAYGQREQNMGMVHTQITEILQICSYLSEIVANHRLNIILNRNHIPWWNDEALNLYKHGFVMNHLVTHCHRKSGDISTKTHINMKQQNFCVYPTVAL